MQQGFASQASCDPGPNRVNAAAWHRDRAGYVDDRRRGPDTVGSYRPSIAVAVAEIRGWVDQADMPEYRPFCGAVDPEEFSQESCCSLEAITSVTATAWREKRAKFIPCGVRAAA